MKTWITKAGVEIPINEMGHRHLLNTIRMLKRHTKQYEQLLIDEIEKTLCLVSGDMATWELECSLSNLHEYGIEPQELYPIYENLVNELHSRLYKG